MAARMHEMWPSESALQCSWSGGLFRIKDHLKNIYQSVVEEKLSLSKWFQGSLYFHPEAPPLCYDLHLGRTLRGEVFKA